MPQNSSQNQPNTVPGDPLGAPWTLRGDLPEEPGRPRARSRGSRGSFRLPQERPGTIWACKMDPKSMKFEPPGEPRDHLGMQNATQTMELRASINPTTTKKARRNARSD